MIFTRVNVIHFLFQRSRTTLSTMDLGMQMKSFNEQKQYDKTLTLFARVQEENRSSTTSLMITQALKACTQLGDLQRGIRIEKMFESRLKDDTYIVTSFIHLYMQFGDIQRAELLFDRSTKKTLSMYTALMKGYITNGMANKAIDLFAKIRQPDQVIMIVFFNACANLATSDMLPLIKKTCLEMPKSFHSNRRLLTSLFDALIKCGDCSSATKIFSKIDKSVISYGNLINGFLKEDNPEKVFVLYRQMQDEGVRSNEIIYLGLIKALTEIAMTSLCESMMEKIPRPFLTHLHIQNALINMWGKTGCVDRAKAIFQTVPQPDRITFTAMINSYGLNGMGNEAIELFRRMPSDFLDESLYVSVLNACSHSGLVNEARTIFKMIQIKTLKIYTAMIDCLSRASFFEEAQQLIDEYERSHSPACPMYMALLSGARNVKNSHLSEHVHTRMKQLFPQLNETLISATVLLANTYASTGNIEKADSIRTELLRLGQRKAIGLSWTTVDEHLYRFRAHDQSHPQSDLIYAEAEKMYEELVQHGHQFDSSWVTRSTKSNESAESILCGHSERLAIAFNFINNRRPKRIQITQNLRICGDCHRATKLIAVIRQCEIIIRDANRIHHFSTSGQCSCNDYF